VEASIHSIGINRLKSERAKKLFFVHYNKDEFAHRPPATNRG
jgi:hypothetical protein